MTTTYCRACEAQTEHSHWHDRAHGIEGTHMAGSERWRCDLCGLTTHARDVGASAFKWDFDASPAIDPAEPAKAVAK